MRVRFPALLAIALVVSAPGAGAQVLRVAMLPVAVHSADESTGYLSEGLADMLSARLERTGAIHVERVKSEGGAVDVIEAVEAVKDLGADYVLFGSFTQFGKGASLDIRCAPVLEDPEASRAALRQVFIQSGSLGDIIPKLDTLAEKIERFLVSGEGVSANAASPNGSPAYDDLRKRVEALEKTVFVEEADRFVPAIVDPEAAEEAAAEVVAEEQAAEAGDDAADADPGVR